MSKHTPGPWMIDPDDRDQVLDSTGQSAIHSTFCGMKFAPEEREANARLITAAPELLEALQEAGSIISQHNLLSDGPDHNRPDLCRDRIDTLRRLFAWMNGPRLAAIAKVEGR